MKRTASIPAGYRLSLVFRGAGSERAEAVAQAIERGEEELSPDIVRHNLGIPRASMPQVPDRSPADLLASKDPSDREKGRAAVEAGADPDSGVKLLEGFVAWLEKGFGIRTERTEETVSYLRATQSELLAEKVIGMADSYYRGNLDFSTVPIVISSDAYLLDGHHRWAALLTVDPEGRIPVWKIGLPIRALLARAFEYPGTFRVDLEDRIVPRSAPLDLGSDFVSPPVPVGGFRRVSGSVKPLSRSGDSMNEKNLRASLIRLAYENPSLRKDLLPLLAEGKTAAPFVAAP